MSVVVNVLVGVGVVLAVVGALILLAKRGVFDPDRNEDSQAERDELAESVGSQDFHIPFRRRVGSWSGPYKVFVASLVLLSLLVLYGVYDVMRTGAPASQYLPTEARFGLVALVGIAGGVKLKSWFDSQIGKLTVIYERTGQEDIVERIPYARTGVSRRNGRVTLPEVADNRLLGLFWRFRQVGEDRRLRAEEKPLDDVIQHLLPDHAKQLPDDGGYQVRTQEDGDKVLSGATSVADVSYSSPKSLSDERSVELREQRRRKEAELSAVQATNTELQNTIRTMEKKIKNQEYKDREELLSDFEDFSEMFSKAQEKLSTDDKSNGTTPPVAADGETEANA